MSCEMVRLGDFPPKKAVPMLRELQKGTIVEGHNFGWRKGKLVSVGRYKGSDVVYIKHKNKELPTMYFYCDVNIPKQNTLFEVEEV